MSPATRRKTITIVVIVAIAAIAVYFSPPVSHLRARRAAFACFAITRTSSQWEDCLRGRGFEASDFAEDDEIQQRLLIQRLQ